MTAQWLHFRVQKSLEKKAIIDVHKFLLIISCIFLGLSSIFLVKNKKLQALVEF